MSIAISIFLGAVLFCVIYLYVNTSDRWNWSRIVKRSLITFGVLIALPAVSYFGLFGYQKLKEDRNEKLENTPKLVTSLKGISIGEKLSDVQFRYGAFKKLDRPNNASYKYDDEIKYGNGMKRISIDARNDFIESVTYICNDSDDYTKVNGVGCGDAGESLLERHGGKVRVLCEKILKEDKPPERVYDVIEYGTRYYLTQNKVDAIMVNSKEELESLVGYNWAPCK